MWLEVWSRPGDPAYGRKIADLPYISTSCVVSHSGVGSGECTLARDYARLTDLLDTAEWSTIKVLDETGVLYEWLPSTRNPETEKHDPDVSISGAGIESIIGFARVEPWDWDGSADFVSTFPDWVWGGRNILSNPGFEDSTEQPIIDELFVVDATGGTYFLSDGVNNTAAIDWDEDNPAVIENALEAAGIYDDCLVTGTGTEDDPFVIEAVDPFEGVTLTVGTGLLVGGTADIVRRQFGALIPNPWTRSQTISRGKTQIFGTYQNFRVVTTQAHSGTYSLLINPGVVSSPGARYPGAQQVVRVKPGGIYQASVWVYPTSGTDTFRFIIRGIDGDFIASNTGGLSSVTLTPNTWNELTISDVDVGDNKAVIFRIANTNPVGTNPGDFYIDDARFDEGMAATTVGDMFSQLYADATQDHPGRIVWEDETIPGSAYLGIDFDAVLDSDGAAWDRDDVALTFNPRMSYIQVLEKMTQEGGYEWRVVADSTPGYYLLQLYNPGTLGGVVAAAIQGGSTDVGRRASISAPGSTDVVVQGAEHLSSRADDAGLISAFGRIEGSILDTNITSLSSAAVSAGQAIANQEEGVDALVYTLAEPAQKPLRAYRPGDTIHVEDPPLVSASRRVAQIQLAATKERGAEYVVTLSDAAPFKSVGGAVVTRNLTGQAMIANAVTGLLRKFEKAPDPTLAALDLGGGGGGMASILIVDEFASDTLQEKADFVITSSQDAGVFLDSVWSNDWQTIWVHGYFVFNAEFTLPTGVQMIGLSPDNNSALEINAPFTVGVGGLLRDLELHIDVTGTAVVVGTNGRLQNLQLSSPDATGPVFDMGTGARASDIWVAGGEAAALFYTDTTWVTIRNVLANNFEGGPVVWIDGTEQIELDSIITNSSDVDLLIDDSQKVTVGKWISAGAGDAASPPVQILASQGITFQGCHWYSPIPAPSAFLIEDSQYVTVDVSNQFSELSPFANDRSLFTLDGSSRCTLGPTVIGLAGGTVRSNVDFVRLVGASDNFLAYGHYEPHGLTTDQNQPRHAILIDASSDCNVVVGNHLGSDATRYTGNVIEDNGTNTQLTFPNDPTYGDNFTDCGS